MTTQYTRDTQGLKHRSISSFPFQKRTTNVSLSLDKQAWTITLSTENKTKQSFVGLPQFWVQCCKCNSFPLQNIFCTNRISKSQRFSIAQICQMSHSSVPVFFPTLPCRRAEQKVSLFVCRGSAFPTTQHSSSSMLRAYWSKQNESQDGHIEVSCDCLRWYSTKSDWLSRRTTSSFFCWTWCFTVPLFRLQLSRCSPLCRVRGIQSKMKWSICFVLTVREKIRQKERVYPSVHVPSPNTLYAKTWGCCKADLWARGERRGGFNWSGISMSLYFDQRSGVVSGSSPSSPLYLPQTLPTPFQSISEQQDLQTEVAPSGPPLSEDDAAAAQTLATSMYRGRRCHWGKIGMDFDLGKVSLYSGRYVNIHKDVTQLQVSR